MKHVLVALLAWCTLTCSVRAAEGPGETVILNANSPWRVHYTWMTIRVKRKTGELQYATVERRRRGQELSFKPVEPTFSERPADGWAAPDFDDAGWAHDRLPIFTRRTRDLGLLCLRGTFTVTEPAPLSLQLTYRGGAAVYVNGKEIARAHLPNGKLTFDTPAEAYPDEAYVSPEGVRLRWIGFGDPKNYKDRFALRDRTLSAKIPASALQTGTNVLAIEVHRAPLNEIYFTARVKNSARYSTIDLCSVERLELTAPVAAGVRPNVSRPHGLQLSNWCVFSTVHNIDYSDPHEELGPIRMAGTRNGAFSGKVVVSSAGALNAVRATASDLKTAHGATLPADGVEIRYARPDAAAESHVESHRGRPPTPYHQRGVRRFDALAEEPPDEVPADHVAGGAVLPIWVTVHVPKDAEPGTYTGTLRVTHGKAEPADVPLRLTVADWALPDTKDFASFLGLVQSPETLAMKYGVPMWSDRHWKLIDRSFELMGQLDSDDVYILPRTRTYFGNEHSMIRWIRKRDGSWTHDFGIVEKYLDTAIKHLGKVPVVAVYAWDVDSGSTYFGKARGEQHAHMIEKTGFPFTVVDPKTGKLTEERGPTWGDPKIREFLKPVFDGLRRMLEERGLAGSMMVGIASDKRPEKDAVADLAAVAPDAPWIIHSHPLTLSLRGRPVGYSTAVWGVYGPTHPSKARYYGWQNPHLAAVFPRYKTAPTGHGLRLNSATMLYRIAMERCLTARGSAGAGKRGLMRGVGRCGADFWPVFPARHGRKKPVCGRYPASSGWHGGWLHNSTPAVLAPGPEGPIATVRFEMLREGIQETECRIWLEKVLTDPARRAKLGPELADRCQRLLDQRVTDQLRAMKCRAGRLSFKWYEGSGIREATAELYAAAARAAAKLKAD
ncbi:MAG: glycoside hydrolase domain-containing protein [Planctomycetota bacterium]